MARQAQLMREQFAQQLIEMQTAFKATVASKDQEVTNAQRLIEHARAEARDADVRALAETAAYHALHSKVESQTRELHTLQARQAREAEIAKEKHEEMVRDTALREESRGKINLEAVEMKAQRFHDNAMGRMEHELTEARAARPSPTSGDSPRPCPACPAKQEIINQLRTELGSLDDQLKQERLKVLEAEEARTTAQNALHDIKATRNAIDAEVQGNHKRIAQLESQVNEGALLQAQIAKERDELRNNSRLAEDEYHRKLRELEADFEERLAHKDPTYESQRPSSSSESTKWSSRTNISRLTHLKVFHPTSRSNLR